MGSRGAAGEREVIVMRAQVKARAVRGLFMGGEILMGFATLGERAFEGENVISPVRRREGHPETG
jgi:hypothetical protein